MSVEGAIVILACVVIYFVDKILNGKNDKNDKNSKDN